MITALGLIVFVWLMFFFLWVRGAIRVRMLTAEKPDAVFVDVLRNGRLSIDLDQINAVLGVPPKRMYTPGSITVVASKEGFEFYSRAFRPRQLCFLPGELVSSLGIERSRSRPAP